MKLTLDPQRVIYAAMKRALRSISALFRSDFAARGDALRAESRANVARNCAQGKAWEGMASNVSLLGIHADSATRTRVIYGGGR
jgi:hypothetical protein